MNRGPKRGLDLLLYWTGDGPHEDHQASAGMGMPLCPGTDKGGFECRHDVPLLFSQRWASVLEEYATHVAVGHSVGLAGQSAMLAALDVKHGPAFAHGTKVMSLFTFPFSAALVRAAALGGRRAAESGRTLAC